MKITLTQETNLSLVKVQVINDLSSSIQNHFLNRIYGNDVHQILIGIICVKPEFDFFYKERKLKYVKEQTIKNALGEIVKIKNSVSYDIKLDFNLLSNSDEEDVQNIVASNILSSIEILNNLPKKAEDFNLELFEIDFKSYLKNQKLISD